MGKTIFAAILASVLASVVTTLVLLSLQTDRKAADEEAARHAETTRQVERERLERRVAELERRVVAAPRAERISGGEATAAAPANGASPPPTAPDGSPYVSRAELDKVLGERTVAAGVAALPAAPIAKKTLEEISRDMNLSAGEEASLREILRESEEEFVRNLFGDKPYDDVKREVLAAKDDPDKQAALMQGVIQNGLANVGKLMTLENRTKKKVEGVLGPERGGKFLAMPRKPVIDPEFEEVLKGRL